MWNACDNQLINISIISQLRMYENVENTIYFQRVLSTQYIILNYITVLYTRSLVLNSSYNCKFASFYQHLLISPTRVPGNFLLPVFEFSFFYVPHKREIRQYLYFWVRIISFSRIFYRFIHVFPNDSISSFF